MGFFGQLFGAAANEQNKIEALEKALKPFIELALASISKEQMDSSPEVRRHAMAYIFGASAYLAEYDGLAEASRYDFAGAMLTRHFALDSAQRAAFARELSRAPDRDPARFFMIEGASALRRWVAFQDPRLAGKLGETLARFAAKGWTATP